MAKLVKEQKEPVVEEEMIPVPTTAKAKAEEVQMSLEKYFKDFRSEVHPYTRAYVYPKYHGILNSKKEWDEELKGKL